MALAKKGANKIRRYYRFTKANPDDDDNDAIDESADAIDDGNVITKRVIWLELEWKSVSICTWGLVVLLQLEESVTCLLARERGKKKDSSGSISGWIDGC